MNISKRGDTFHVRRRVPKRFSRVEDREFFATTLNTDSESEARE